MDKRAPWCGMLALVIAWLLSACASSGEKGKQTGRVAVCTCRIDFGEQRFHICFRELPGNIGMTAVAGDTRSPEDGTARWQLVRKRDRKRLLHQFRITSASERLVVILLVSQCLWFSKKNRVRAVCSTSSHRHSGRLLPELEHGDPVGATPDLEVFLETPRQPAIISGSFKCPRAPIKLARTFQRSAVRPVSAPTPRSQMLAAKAIGHTVGIFHIQNCRPTDRSRNPAR